MAKMAQEVDCPLLELPPEIRNTIWELILPEMFDVFTVNRPPALLGTCRQIRNEAHDLFFSTAVFEAQSHEIVCNFLGAFSPKAHASITNFRFFPYFVRDHSPQLQKLRLLRVPVAQAGLDYLTEDLKLVGVLLRPGALQIKVKLSEADKEQWRWACSATPARYYEVLAAGGDVSKLGTFGQVRACQTSG